MKPSSFYNILMSLDQLNGYEAMNSFSRRPTLPQIGSYLIILMVNISFWGFLQPHFAQMAERFAMIALFTISLVVLILTAAITSIIDPSDPMVRQHRNNNLDIIRSHLDQCLYCDNCRSYVLSTSRHCKQCDRCIHKFDHHCIWINNCIGQNNYRLFIAMIYSALIYLLLYFIALILLWKDDAWSPFLGEMVFDWITGVVSFVFILMVGGLIWLHMYLIYHDLTTFEYILSKKTEEEKRRFAPPIKIQLQQKKKPSEEEMSNENEHEITENQFEPQLSAFQDVKGHREAGEETMPSGQYLKQIKNKGSIPKFDNFQTLELYNNDEMEQEKNLSELYKRSRSLKLLVGDSVMVRSRKGSLSQCSQKSEKKGRSYNSSVSSNKIDYPIYIKEKAILEEDLDKTN